MLQRAHLNITMDGQFGSTGKGLLNDFIARNALIKPDICISNAAPNAGHTFVDDNGQKRTVFHLPVSGVQLPHTIIYLCAGSIIDPELLLKEMREFEIDPARVYIHPRACILLPEHREREASGTSGATTIASTRKGVGAALGDKVARVAGSRTAGQYLWSTEDFPGLKIQEIDLMEQMNHRKTCLMEVPQGFSLSLNHGCSYPQCTSRDLTVSQALNDAGVHPSYLGSVLVSLRTYPIRVGHIYNDEGVKIGDSGPFYSDSDEKSWDELGQVPELTTVTKRERRIATFSYLEYKKMLQHLRPDTVFINFANYLRNESELKELWVRMQNVQSSVGQDPTIYIGVGPAASDVFRHVNLQHTWDRIKEARGE